MRKDKTVKIDKKDFLITQMNPEDALKVLIWLTKSVGGSLGRSLGAFESLEKALAGQVNMDALGGALESVFDRIDEKETIEKIGILLESVSYEGGDLNLNSPIFYGETLLILKITRASMEVNFKSFLDEISGAVAKLKKRAGITQGDAE